MEAYFAGDGSLERRLEALDARAARAHGRAVEDDDAMVISDGDDDDVMIRSGARGHAREDDSDDDWRAGGSDDDSPIELASDDDEDRAEETARIMREVLAARHAREQRSTRARIGFGATAFEARDGGRASGGEWDGAIDLPDGIDREEARMLEAAMLGVAYVPPANRVVDYGASAPAPEHVLNSRVIADETDRAYQASLRADQEKEAARRAEQLAKEMMEAEKAEAEKRERARVEAEERARAKIAMDAAEALPDEPSADAPGAVNIAFRLPDGSRVMRRFLTSHNVRTLFSFIDGYEKLHGTGARLTVEPGTYRFVAQHPRRVIEIGDGNTIEQVGLTHKQEALMIDLL